MDFALLLHRCLKAKASRPAKQVHAWLVVSGTDMNNLSLSSKLLGVYACCGDIQSASFLFKNIPRFNIFAVNWMVSALAYYGYFVEALGYFSLVSGSLNLCNKFTFSVALKACVGLMDLEKGKQVHGVVSKLGLGNQMSVGNVLIDMYCKCGRLSYARKLFDGMLERDVATWTSMICGYCTAGKIEQALVLFESMKLEGVEPNDFTWNAMIYGYARKGDACATFSFLNRMKSRGLVPDTVTWNAIISGFIESGQPLEAFKLFQKMVLSGIKPNELTVTGLLPVCGVLGSIRNGKEVHCLIYRRGININVFVASALIDMYSKCGSLENATTVFENAQAKNTASWNALIGCYAKNGMVESAINLFERMQQEGICANSTTLTCILTASSHCGSVEEGVRILRSMKEKHTNILSKEHCACIVDMLCRSGEMVVAYELVKEIPFQLTESILGAFLNGCRIHERRDLAKLMAERIMKNGVKDPAVIVTLSNMYAADGEWEEVENVRGEMKGQKIHKRTGSSRVGSHV